MAFKELVVMPEDSTDRTALAVLKVWGPASHNKATAIYTRHGGKYRFSRGMSVMITLQLHVLPDLLTNRFQHALITINGMARTYRPDTFRNNFITIRKSMVGLSDEFDIEVELHIVGEHNGKFALTLKVQA